MQKEVIIEIPPQDAASEDILIRHLHHKASGGAGRFNGYHILKKSIDARGSRLKVRIAALVFIDENIKPRSGHEATFRDVTHSPRSALIIGGGPAGLFAALRLLESGIRPIILERGKDVRARRRDLAALNKNGILNPESNYCFGEGGAGTYSDGKLYTRSHKRGDLMRMLNLFVRFGANENILYEAHPHIGTNKLPGIISAMREAITGHGGSMHFNQKVTGIKAENGSISEVITASGDSFRADAVILATGHSARDIFELLKKEGLEIQAKPFALGVRVEHPQELINGIQYHHRDAMQWLPPASYSLVEQVEGKGVFSFCMCPGGIIAPAATSEAELVVNGWSPSRRNNPFANSGMVVQVEKEDAYRCLKDRHIDADDPLLFMYFQQQVERLSFEAGGGHFRAPAQRMTDFSDRRLSSSIPACSYGPGIQSARLDEVLPDFIYERLAVAFRSFGKKMKGNGHGFFTNEALVVATESRTSSPVRIPRDPLTLLHPQTHNLYPCGEGAGYAGGIVSAAMDGDRVALQIASRIVS